MPMQGQELKERRKLAGLSQQELAAEIDMARETVGKMERGEAPIEKRTELAILYLTQNRGPRPPSLAMIIEEVEGLLTAAQFVPSGTEADFHQWKDTLQRSHGLWVNGEGTPLGTTLLYEACLRAEQLGIAIKGGDSVRLTKLLQEFNLLHAAWGLVTPPVRGILNQIAALNAPVSGTLNGPQF